MKFVCERCHTKYSIADDKVRQKILKIRCKTCENVITIRDAVVVTESASARSESSLASAAPGGGSGAGSAAARSVEWHLAVNGRQEGPLGLAALAMRIQAIGRDGKDDEVYVWNEHLDGWKDPKAVPEVAAELRARTAPPLPPGVKRPPTPALGGRVGLPPPGGTGRSSAGLPAVGHGAGRGPGAAVVSSGRSSGGAASAAAYAEMADEQPEMEEKTQISALDASLLAPDAAPAARPLGRTASKSAIPASFPALADLSVSLPLPGGNGASARPATSSGLEALDFVPLPVSASPSAGRQSAPAASAAAAVASAPGSGVVAGPVVGGSTSMLLSQIGGRVARVRHPAIKYVITGGVLVALVIVAAVLTLTTGNKSNSAEKPVVTVTPEPGSGADPEAVARAEAEKYFKSMVGESNAPAQASSKTVGPPQRRPVAPARQRAPEAVKPPPVAPPPVAGVPAPTDGSGVTRRFALDERRVAIPRQGREGQSQGGGGSFDQGKFMAVFKQQDHYQALKSCYDRALKRDQKLRLGRLDITVAVGETGSVRRVKALAPAEYSGVSSCVESTVRRWRFPATNESYEATFPMLLHGSSE